MDSGVIAIRDKFDSGNIGPGPEFAPLSVSLSADDLSRPRAKYYLYYPLILASAALLLWMFPTDLMTGVVSAVGTVMGSIMMWEFLFTNPVIRLTRVTAMALVIGYGAGTFNTWFTLPRAGYSLASAIGQTVPELANGVAAALMSCAILLVFGEFWEKPVLTTAQPLVITQGVKRVIQINSAVIFISFLAGKFDQGGIVKASTMHAGVFAVFLQFLLDPTAILAVVAFLVEESAMQKRFYGFIVVFLAVVLLSQGRMNVVYPILVSAGLARFAGYRWGQLSWKRVVLIAAAISFISFGFIFYQAFRLAGRQNSRSLTAETKQVQRWAAQGRAWKIASRSTAQNLPLRTLVVSFLSDLLYRTKTMEPAHGKDLLLQIETSIPSIIYRNKPDMVEEGLASQTFKVFYTDQPNSIFTIGALDFGIWGVLIFPIVVVLLYSQFLRITYSYFSYEVSLYGIGIFLLTSITAEHQFVAYLISIRDVLTFAAFLYVISKVPAFRLMPDSAEETLAS